MTVERTLTRRYPNTPNARPNGPNSPNAALILILADLFVWLLLALGTAAFAWTALG